MYGNDTSRLQPGAEPAETMNRDPRAEAPDYRALLQTVLATIPTAFGKLAYLAELRNPQTGTYSHQAAGEKFAPQVIDEVLRQEHVYRFEAWLLLNLEDQMCDFAAYLLTHVANCASALRQWREQCAQIAFVPGGALEAQRQLFWSDLEILLSTMCDGKP